MAGYNLVGNKHHGLDSERLDPELVKKISDSRDRFCRICEESKERRDDPGSWFVVTKEEMDLHLRHAPVDV